MKPFFLTAALLLGLSQLAAAQGPGSGGPAPGTPTAPVDPTAPLDGGASLLLASGLTLGVCKFRQRRQAVRWLYNPRI